MRNRLWIFLIVPATVLFFNFKKRSITCYLTGHIRNNKNSFVILNKLKVFVKSNGRILNSAITDNKGDFDLEFNTDVNDTLFKFYYSQPMKGAILLKTVRRFESDEPEIMFYIPSKKFTLKK